MSLCKNDEDRLYCLEMGLLGKMLIDPYHVVPEVEGRLRAYVWTCRWNREMYRTMLRMYSNVETIDAVRLRDRLRKDISNVPTEYLARALEAAPDDETYSTERLLESLLWMDRHGEFFGPRKTHAIYDFPNRKDDSWNM